METPKYNGQELVDRGSSYVNPDGDIKPSADLEGIDNDEEAGELYEHQMDEIARSLGGRAVNLVQSAKLSTNIRSAGDGGIINNPPLGVELNNDNIQAQLNKIDRELADLQRQYDSDPDIQAFERDWDRNDQAGLSNIEPDSLQTINRQRGQLEWERSMLLRELEK